MKAAVVTAWGPSSIAVHSPHLPGCEAVAETKAKGRALTPRPTKAVGPPTRAVQTFRRDIR